MVVTFPEKIRLEKVFNWQVTISWFLDVHQIIDNADNHLKTDYQKLQWSMISQKH